VPARLVSVGDAVASFNPIYGQGLSSAALHASCLAEYLESTQIWTSCHRLLPTPADSGLTRLARVDRG